MATMRQDILNALETDRVVSAQRHPELARALNAYRFRGSLTAVLPGIYALSGNAASFETRVAAATASPMGFVVVGSSAAKLTWWPELEVTDVEIAHRDDHLPQPGFAISQRFIPPSLLVQRSGATVTCPALTVLDLIPSLGPSCVDEALRRRVVTIGLLQATLAMTPRRRGNKLRREILLDSRDQPWSALERLTHRMLRESGIKGWTTNHPVHINGHTYYLDVALPQLKIAVEVDGFEFHGDHQAFHYDRTRDADLTADGWHVIRFSEANIHRLVDVLTALIKQRRIAA